MRKIADLLLQRSLAACVQIQGNLESHYRWKGTTEVSSEWSCTIKTRRDHVPQIIELIQQHHPYDVPEVIVIPILDGSEAYVSWMREETEG